jgi:DNA repair photolyase
MIHLINAKSILHYHKKTFSTNWDANIYRGCGHRCIYCFAQYSHKYLEADFFKDIFVKTNAAEILAKEFSKKGWKGHPVCIGGVSDPYQNAEADFEIIPKVLKVFIEYKNPLVFATKSILLLRDIDLFAELAKVTEVSVAVSVSVLNENYRKLIEPNAPAALDRLNMLKKLKDIGCNTGILLMPILPHISDDNENLEEIFRIAKSLEVDFISTWPLHLRGKTKPYFFNFLLQRFPQLLPIYKELYRRSSEVDSEYRNSIMIKIKKLRQKYQLFNKYNLQNTSEKELQLNLFS